MSRVWKSVSITLLAALVLLAAQGCNTVRGVGKDVEQGGKAIQRSTEKK